MFIIYMIYILSKSIGFLHVERVSDSKRAEI